MTESSIAPDGVERIEAAHEKYVTALREWNSLRCEKARCGDHPDYAARVDDGQRRAKEAFAEWAMLFEHEPGVSLAAGEKYDFV